MPRSGDLSATEERDLHDAQPLWTKSPHRTVVHSKSPSRQHYDVVIVGAGISGALMAERLANGKRSLLVLDRRQAVSGSTIASTAMIQHELDVPLHRLARSIGKQKAARAWRRSARAVERLGEQVRALKIACSFRTKCSLYLAGDAYGYRALQTECKARQSAGLSSQYLDAEQLREQFGLERTGALLSPVAASCDPAQLTAGLFRAARRRGLELVEGVRATDCREFGDVVAISLDPGGMVSADYAIFCSGYEFLKPMRRAEHRVISTWAIASPPGWKVPAWLAQHLVWEASDPYLYLRTTSDGRILAGGEDESDEAAFRSPQKLRQKGKTIAAKVSRLLGIPRFEPAYAWAAGFGTTPTGLPYIDRAPGMQRVFSVMGFGGNGITFSQVASEVVSAAIEGQPDSDADLFRA